VKIVTPMSDEEEQIKRILAILHHIKEHGAIGAEEIKNISLLKSC
jgi:hypothetical protein